MDDFEARVIAIEMEPGWIVCCYAPATGSKEKQDKWVNIWNPALGSYLRKLRSTGKGVILIGDTNVAPSAMDITIPPEDTPEWMLPGEYPCASKRE